MTLPKTYVRPKTFLLRASVLPVEEELVWHSHQCYLDSEVEVRRDLQIPAMTVTLSPCPFTVHSRQRLGILLPITLIPSYWPSSALSAVTKYRLSFLCGTRLFESRSTYTCATPFLCIDGSNLLWQVQMFSSLA